MDSDGAEMVRRREACVAPRPEFRCGYGKLMSGDILQADTACDWDFLKGTEPTSDPERH